MSALDFTIYAGHTYDALIVTMPVSLVGLTEVTFHANRADGEDTPLIECTLTGGDVTVTDEPGGVFELVIPGAKSIGLEGEVLVYDMFVEGPANWNPGLPALEGSLTIELPNKTVT